MQNSNDPRAVPPPRLEAESEAAESVDRMTEFNRFRGLLFSIAYRMLGSVADAEDMLQETFIRWHGAADGEIQSTRAFLVTIVSRLCINHLQSARVQREEYIGQWLPEPLVTESNMDPFTILRIDESLSMAFLVLLERLNPVERAVFLLHEVFEYDHAEIARTVGKDEANCRQILKRARQHIADVRPRFEASLELREDMLAEFLQATNTGDLDRLVGLLTGDAVLHSDGGGKAPAVPNLVYGARNVARAIVGARKKLVPHNLTTRMVRINGEPGVVSYLDGRPYSVLTLSVVESRIQSIYIITNPEKLAHLVPLPPPC
jgi:RNA polymerase sigma-70 factor (ECF subfamily)